MQYKNSKQREMILNFMKNVQGHVSAEEIYRGLNASQSISLATVYRNLNILADMNEIRKIAHPTYGYVYDKTCKRHYHFFCKQCQKLIDLPMYDEGINQMAAGFGFDVEANEITFTGICQDCKGKNEKES